MGREASGRVSLPQISQKFFWPQTAFVLSSQPVVTRDGACAMKTATRTAALLLEATLTAQKKPADPTNRVLAALRLARVREALAVGVVALSVTACGNFALGTVQPQLGKSASDMQLDIAICKDQAYKRAGTPDRQAAAFVMGLTIVGAPVAFEIDKATQRSVFRDCMESQGYRVMAPVEVAR